MCKEKDIAQRSFKEMNSKCNYVYNYSVELLTRVPLLLTRVFPLLTGNMTVFTMEWQLKRMFK